jgi:ABC-type multidrug transport system ATPase subunit
MAVIHVSGFRKTYGSTVAVDDVSFDVNAGEIFLFFVANSSSWPSWRRFALP